MEAWARYRPVKSKSKESKSKPKAQYVGDLKKIFPETFINKMMANMKLKQYDFKSTDKQIRRKNTYKTSFLQYYKERHNDAGNDHGHQLIKEIPTGETEIVDTFLKQFVLDCNVPKNNILDIKLALKAVPSKITSMNEFQCNLFMYQRTNSSIIDYQNSETDKLFKYFDDRNMTRLNKLNTKASITKDQTHQLKEMGSTVLSILKKITDVGSK